MGIYLDYNATAPLRDEARAAMLAAFDAPGNPSSVHAAGRHARARVEDARRTLARAVGAAPADIVFTGGGTEANNLGLLGLLAANRCTHLFVSATEHPCVHAAAEHPGLPVHLIPASADGVFDLDHLRSVLARLDQEARPILALMLANNETGTIQPVAEAAQLMHAAGGFIHVDAVQAFGKMPLSLADLGADTLAVSAHKIGGPMGVGALALACGTKLAPRNLGGGQERGLRGGTENLAGIAGFAAAAAAALTDLDKNDSIRMLRDYLQEQLLAIAPDALVVGGNAPRLGNTLCLATPGFAADTQVMRMDLAGFAISSGSACSSGKVKKSAVLQAMHVPDTFSSCAIRISLGKTTTKDELDSFAAAWGAALASIQEKKSA